MDTQDEIVRIGTGTSETVELWHNALTDNGIESKVVGEDLDGGMGTVIPNSVELWVFEKDARNRTNLPATMGAAAEQSKTPNLLAH